MIELRKRRFDYFLIWGHGVRCLDEILGIIRSDKCLKIVKLIFHEMPNIASVVKAVYSYDYAPFEHLKEKTRYLMTTPKTVVLVFIRNLDVNEVVRGTGAFRHIECDRIKRVKDVVRDRFNPYFEGKRTEDHVIHASDNEKQTDHILKYLGFVEGVRHLAFMPNQYLDLPCHLPPFSRFSLRLVPVSRMFFSMVVRDDANARVFRKAVVAIAEAPHFQFLCGNEGAYREYYRDNRGVLFQDDHGVDRFRSLAKSLDYLEGEHARAYILVRYVPNEDCYVIQDGVHRAAILAFRKKDRFVVAVMGS